MKQNIYWIILFLYEDRLNMVKKKRIPKNPLLKFGLTTICIEEVNSNFWEHSVSQYVFVIDAIVAFRS